MGFDMNSSGDQYLSINHGGFTKVFYMAMAFGYEPSKTLPPQRWKGEWGGDYFINDGQRMTAEDAKNLATGIRKVITCLETEDDLSDDDYRVWLVIQCDYDNERSIRRLKEIAEFFESGEITIR